MSIKFPVVEKQRSSENLESVVVRLHPEVIRDLDLLAEAMGMDRSKALRWCLDYMLNEARAQGVIKSEGQGK